MLSENLEIEIKDTYHLAFNKNKFFFVFLYLCASHRLSYVAPDTGICHKRSPAVCCSLAMTTIFKVYGKEAVFGHRAEAESQTVLLGMVYLILLVTAAKKEGHFSCRAGSSLRAAQPNWCAEVEMGPECLKDLRYHVIM